MAAVLNKELGLSHERTVRVLELGYGLQWSRSGVCRALQRLGNLAEPTYQQLQSALRLSPVVWLDDTGWRVAARPQNLRVLWSEQVTVYVIEAHRRYAEAAAILPRQSTVGHTPAPRAATLVYLSALSWFACHQQLRRAGDSADGDGAENLGRQSDEPRRPHPADSGQCLAHLLAAGQRRLSSVREVIALCSSDFARDRPGRGITLTLTQQPFRSLYSLRPCRRRETQNQPNGTL